MIKQILFIIKGYALWIWYYLSPKYRNSIKAEAKRRIKICEACEEHFDARIRACKLCGCLMDVKTKMPLELDDEGISLEGCWERKW